MDFGAMMEAATVLGALQGAFTTLVTQMGAITNMGAQAIRIQQLWDMLEETDLDDTGIRTEIHSDLQALWALLLLAPKASEGYDAPGAVALGAFKCLHTHRRHPIGGGRVPATEPRREGA